MQLLGRREAWLEGAGYDNYSSVEPEDQRQACGGYNAVSIIDKCGRSPTRATLEGLNADKTQPSGLTERFGTATERKLCPYEPSSDRAQLPVL
jgi:hypothetical protein